MTKVDRCLIFTDDPIPSHICYPLNYLFNISLMCRGDYLFNIILAVCICTQSIQAYLNKMLTNSLAIQVLSTGFCRWKLFNKCICNDLSELIEKVPRMFLIFSHISLAIGRVTSYLQHSVYPMSWYLNVGDIMTLNIYCKCRRNEVTWRPVIGVIK